VKSPVDGETVESVDATGESDLDDDVGGTEAVGGCPAEHAASRNARINPAKGRMTDTLGLQFGCRGTLT
jgi:hypothetical protein